MSTIQPTGNRTSVPTSASPAPDASIDELRASMPPPPRSSGRASKMVMLGLLGVGAIGVGFYGSSLFSDSDEEPAVAAAPADQQAATQRNGYATREECEANYSKEQCNQGQTQRPGGLGFMPIFWGPFYNNSPQQFRPAGDPGPGRMNQGVVSEPAPRSASARSGFGSNAAGHGSSAAGAHSGVGHS